MRQGIIFCFLLIGELAFSQPKVRTCADDSLNGPVHYVFHIGHEDSLLAEYDIKGRALFVKQDITEMCWYEYAEISLEQHRYDYDAAGRLAHMNHSFRQVTWEPEPVNEKFHSCDEYYTWNKWGQVERSYRISTDSLESLGETVFYTYDKRGNVIVKNDYSAARSTRSDSLLRKTEFTYDRKNRLLNRKIFLYTADTFQLQEVHTRSYYSSGLLKTRCTYDGAGHLLSSDSTVYDGRRRVMEQRSRNVSEMNISWHWTCTYSDTGRFETYLLRVGLNSFRTESTFNKQGDETLRRYYDTKGLLDVEYTVSYVYDEYGNWTRFEQRTSNGETCIRERKIVYWTTK